MRTVKDGSYSIEIDSHTGAASFCQIRIERTEQFYDIGPFDVGADGILEDGAKRFTVFAAEVHSVKLRHYALIGKFPALEIR